MDETEDDIVACAEAGVVGYVPRDSSLEDFVQVLRSVARDELIASPQIAARLLNLLEQILEKDDNACAVRFNAVAVALL